MYLRLSFGNMYRDNSSRMRAQPPMVRRLVLPVSCVKYFSDAIRPRNMAIKMVRSYSGSAPVCRMALMVWRHRMGSFWYRLMSSWMARGFPLVCS